MGSVHGDMGRGDMSWRHGPRRRSADLFRSRQL